MKTTIEIEAPTYFETIKGIQEAMIQLIGMKEALEEDTIKFTINHNYFQMKLVVGPLPDRCLTEEEIKHEQN